mgnify:CR=1 FL=1
MITHLNDPDSDKVIIFVHGLGGAESTWKKFTDYMNGNWKSGISFDVKYFLFYRSFISKQLLKTPVIKWIIGFIIWLLSKIYWFIKLLWSKRNTHNANILEDYINKNCNEHKNIIIVAHSMGGLIARQYLINVRKKNLDFKRFKILVTYATPHKGSHVASVFNINNIIFFRTFYKYLADYFNYRLCPQLGDLSPTSEFINKLETDWTSYGIESKLLFLRVAGKKDLLVRRESAILHENNIENIYEYDYSHGGLINPNVDNKFEPIDLFIEKLNKTSFDVEEYYSELDDEIIYEDNEDDDESY